MKSVQGLFPFLAAALLWHSAVQAQTTTTNGEIVFDFNNQITASAPTVNVTIELFGAVFNEEGNYSNEVDDVNHSDVSYYGSPYLNGTTNQLSPTNPVIAWESAYLLDARASTTYCNGMVGWGLYKVSAVYGGMEFVCFFNTIDGNWMNGSGDVFNFRVNLETGSLTMDLWDGSSWQSITQYSTITFWEKNNTTRERDEIKVSDKPFTILPYTPYGGGGTVTYPIFVNGYATIDVNIAEAGEIKIADNKLFIITDFVFGGTSYTTTINFRQDGYIQAFGSGCALYIIGSALHSVILQPITLRGGLPRRSWVGLRVGNTWTDNHYSQIEIYNADINYASVGIQSEFTQLGSQPIYNYFLDVNNTTFFGGHYGIDTEISPLNVRNTDFDNLVIGIRIFKSNKFYSQIKRVDNCRFTRSAADGIQVSGLSGKGEDYELLLVTNSLFEHSANRGIYSYWSTVKINNCVFHENGHLWDNNQQIWVPNGLGFDGIYAYWSEVSTHESVFTNNSAYGVHIDRNTYGTGAATWFARRPYYLEPMNANEKKGLNCFAYNDISIGLNHSTLSAGSTFGVFGMLTLTSKFPGFSLSWVGGDNSFLWPRWNDGGRYINATIDNDSRLEARKNYWSDYTWNARSGGSINPQNPLMSQPVTCAEAPSPQYGDSINANGFSDYDSYVLYCMLVGDVDSAIVAVYDSIQYKTSPSNATVYGLTLYSNAVYDNNETTLDSLKRYSYYVNPGSESNMIYLHYYLKANMMLGRYEYAYSVADSILKRTTSESDSLNARVTQALIIGLEYSDTTMALSILDSLLLNYPEEMNIRSTIYRLTGDFSIIDSTITARADSILPKKSFPPRRTERQLNPETLYIYPNPSVSGQIHLYIPGIYSRGDMNIRLYDVQGKLVWSAARIQYGGSAQVRIPHGLPSGLYTVEAIFDGMLYRNILSYRK